jgi:hypothetical protein
LTGPQSKGCSVSLSSPALSPILVYLKSDNTSVTVPNTVTVPVGSTNAAFNAVSANVDNGQSATLTASATGVSRKILLHLYPGQAILTALSAFSCGDQSLSGPQTHACSVNLSSAAMAPFAITLSSDNPAVVVPASVTVGQGASSAGFNLTAAAVNSPQSVTLTASANGISKTQVVQLLATTASSPAPAPAPPPAPTPTPTPAPPTSPAPAPAQTTQYQVELSWNAPSDSNDAVAGYKVYRSPSGTTAYQLLTTSIDAQTTYTDSTVQLGQTYDYYVTSVDSPGAESTPSNTTTVPIPAE